MVTRLGLGTAPLASIFWGNDEDARRGDRQPSGRTRHPAVRFGAAVRARASRRPASARRWRRSVATMWWSPPKPADRSSHRRAASLDAVFDFSRDATMRQLESSLERLGLDRIDIVHIHDPEDHLADAIDGTYAALDRLRTEGVVRAVSVGTNVVETARFFLRNADLDCVMVAGRLTLLDHSAADLVAECRAAGVAYLAAGVFNSGVLADPQPGSWFDYAPASVDVLQRAAAMRAICESHGVSLRTAALHYPLTVDGVTAVIVGMSSPTEVDDNLAAFRSTIPPALWTDLALTRWLSVAESVRWRSA